MQNIVRTTLAVSIALALTACNHNDDAVVTTPSTLDMSGAAIKGALIDAKVQIYRASDTAFATPLTTEPVDVQTDENGDYTAQIVDDTGVAIVGALIVKITADDDTTMRCDAAVTCADGTERGKLIPNSEVLGLSLSTFTEAKVDETGKSLPVDADVNTFTSMATDAVLAQVTANPAIKIDDPASLKSLQQNASLVVGKILGVDLSTTNVFDIKIVDSTDTEAVAAAVTSAGSSATITNTLTSFNASFAALTVEEDSSIADTINSYVQTTAVVSSAVLKAVAKGESIANALTSDQTILDAQTALASAQTEISAQATLIQSTIKEAVESLPGEKIVFETVEIPAITPDIEIDLGDIVVITGATGGTN